MSTTTSGTAPCPTPATATASWSSSSSPAWASRRYPRGTIATALGKPQALILLPSYVRRAWDWMCGTDGTAAPTAVSLDELHQTLNADTEAERLRAVYALAARGEEAMPVLLNALRGEAKARLEANLANEHTNPSQLDAVFALSAIGHPAVTHMVELLGENDWWLRAAAADVLGDLGTTASDAVPHLTHALDDEAEWVRRNAVEALGNIGRTLPKPCPP